MSLLARLSLLALLTLAALLLTLLSLLSVSARLSLLSLTALLLGVGLGTFLQAPSEGVDAARQITRAFQRVGVPIAAVGPQRRRRFIEFAPQRVEVGFELLLQGAGELLQLGAVGAGNLARVIQLFLDLVIADLTGGLLDFARRLTRFAHDVGRRSIELIFEPRHLLAELAPPVGQLLRALLTVGAGGRQIA